MVTREPSLSPTAKRSRLSLHLPPVSMASTTRRHQPDSSNSLLVQVGLGQNCSVHFSGVWLGPPDRPRALPKLRSAVHRWLALDVHVPEVCVDLHGCSCFTTDSGHDSFHWRRSLLLASSVWACGRVTTPRIERLVTCGESRFGERQKEATLNRWAGMVHCGVVGACDSAELWSECDRRWSPVLGALEKVCPSPLHPLCSTPTSSPVLVMIPRFCTRTIWPLVSSSP